MAPTPPPESQVDDELNLAMENIDAGTSAYPGMTYEEGVEATIRWMRGDSDSPPMTDE